MTGRFSDGYDWLPAGASSATIDSLLQARGYYIRGAIPGSFSGGASLTTGRFNYGQRISVNHSTAVGLGLFVVRPIAAQNSAGGYVSAGWNIKGAATAFPMFGVYDLVNDQPLCCVQFKPNGVVAAYRGGPNGTFLGASDIWTYNDNADIDVEAFFKVHGSTGEIEVRINTVPVLHLVNVNTQPGSNAYFDGVFWGDWQQTGGGSVAAIYSIDDFRYYDTAGSINNAFLGTCRVQTSLVNGNGATTNFSKSNPALANWQCLLNQNVDDSLFLEDPTVGDVNLSTIQPLVNSPEVHWVQVDGFYRQDDATQRQVKNRIVSGGVTQDGAAYFTSQSYTCDSDVFELNPATGLTFTGAQFNALQIGTLIYA